MNDTLPAIAPPSPREQEERTKAVWYAFGAIDTMRQNGATLDAIDAHNFAILFGTLHKLPGVTPTVAHAWAAYVKLRAGGATKLTGETLAANAAKAVLTDVYGKPR